jgi:tetratricopeptide (TPR) repeat protein
MSGTGVGVHPGESIFCPDCGELIPRRSNFCFWCGCDLGFIRPYLEIKGQRRNIQTSYADSDQSTDTAPDSGTPDTIQIRPAADMSGERYPVPSGSSPDIPCVHSDINLTDLQGYADALKNEGDECYQQGEYHEAIYFYDVALRINPDYRSAWNNQGLALEKLGRFREAQDCLDQVHRLRQSPAIADADVPGEDEKNSTFSRAKSCFLKPFKKR